VVRENEIRDGEVAVDPPPATDAGLVFIGLIRTPLLDIKPHRALFTPIASPQPGDFEVG